MMPEGISNQAADIYLYMNHGAFYEDKITLQSSRKGWAIRVDDELTRSVVEPSYQQNKQLLLPRVVSWSS